MQAHRLGHIMAQKAYCPALVLCSPAQRTRQTLEGILKTIPDLVVEYPERLYSATKDDHMDVIHGLGTSYESAMIIAHNPGVFELAHGLANGDTRDMIGFSYPPATMVVLKFDVKAWADVDLGLGKVLNVYKADV